MHSLYQGRRRMHPVPQKRKSRTLRELVGRHANANITCCDRHKPEEFDPDVSHEHYKQYRLSDNEYGTKEYRIPATAMMAPDYAWWHGFYECKNRYNRFMDEARRPLAASPWGSPGKWIPIGLKKKWSSGFPHPLCR